MTAAEFLACRSELPDGGRWTELIAGEPVILDPPDQQHGDIVLALSKAVARVLRPDSPTVAAFDLGIPTGRRPDTVRFPAMSLFAGGNRFAVLDAVIADAVPALVVEIASQNDRRRSIAARVHEYHTAGTRVVWVADPQSAAVTILTRNTPATTHTAGDRLAAPDLLPGLDLTPATLFAEPPWWRGKRH